MSYTLQANLVDNISPGLVKIKNQLGATTSAFNGLKTALAGIAFGALIKDVLNYADSISDLSDSTGLAIQNIVGFQKAVQGAGGSTEGAQKGILKLVNSIGDAAAGSAEAQDAFAQVGVTLKDLSTLSEQDILRKTVAGLAKINDVSTQSILKTQLLGKEFRGVSAAKLDESLDKATEASAKYAESIKKAADAQEAFDKAASAAKLAVIDLISPVTALSGALGESRFDFFITGLVKLTAAAAAFFAVMKLASIFGGILAGLTGLAAAFGTVAAGIIIVTTALFGWFALAGGMNGVLSSIFNVNIVDVFTEKVKNAYRAVREFVGLPRISVDSNAGAGRGGNAETLAQQQARGEALAKEEEEARKVTDAFNKQKLALGQIAEEFNKQNKQTLDGINLENSLIGKSKEYSDVVKAQEDIYKRSADASDKLRDAKDKLTDAEKRKGLGDIIDAQIKKIQEIAQVDAERVKQATENANRLQGLDQLRLFGIKNELELTNKLQEVQDTMAKSSMSELEKKYYDIETAALAASKAAIAVEEARIGRKLSVEESAQYYATATEGSQKLKDSTKELYDNSRQFSTGWKQAFNDYAESATNAAEQARNIFQRVTQSMEDMLMTFFKTGKFEWKNFANSIIDEMMRIQVRQLALKITGMGGSGGGGLGSLLGFANGGVIPTNGPVIVGERGPEIISGAAGRTVTPNNQLGGGSVTYNINAVDALSFKQMLAQDPTFLHAVAEQGRRTLPGAR